MPEIAQFFIPNKFVNPVNGPGWVDQMDEFVGVAGEAKLDVAPFVEPWAIMHGFYWPLESLVPVDPKADIVKLIKKAKAKAAKIVKKKARPLALRKELHKKVGGHPGTCSYVKEYEGGYRVWHVKDACHYRIANNEGGHRKAINVALHVQAHHKEFTAEQQKVAMKYMNYVMNRSPMACAFKTKKASEAIKEGILMDVNATVHEIACGAIAIRQIWEHGGCLEAFEHALKLKASEHVAWIIANTHVRLEGGKWNQMLGGGHQVLSGDCVYEQVIQTFKDGLHVIGGEKKAYKDTTGHYKVQASFSPSTRGYGEGVVPKGMHSISAFYTKNCPKIKVGEGFYAKTTVTDEGIKALIKVIDADIKKLFV